MISEILVRYLHFLSIILVVSTVLWEHLLVKPAISRAVLNRVGRIDIIYGIAALVVLITGLAQWLWMGKPAAFYSRNPVFHTKLLLFVVVGILSIYPTVFFIRNRKGDDADEIAVPKGVIMCLRVELLMLIILPLLATMMARGIGIPLVKD